MTFSSPTKETMIAFHNEPWTGEGARLLLELDEGWLGYYDDVIYKWHDEVYTAYSSICSERKWKCNTRAASKAMVQALRTGEIDLNLSSATRTSDGYAQWSLNEMRAMGAQMRLVADRALNDKPQTVGWEAQMEEFVEAMKTTTSSYSLNGRTVKDFATRAGKFLPNSILLLIDPKRPRGKQLSTKATAKSSENKSTSSTQQSGKRTSRITKVLALSKEMAVDRDDQPQPTMGSNASTKISGRKRKSGVDVDSSYHDSMRKQLENGIASTTATQVQMALKHCSNSRQTFPLQNTSNQSQLSSKRLNGDVVSPELRPTSLPVPAAPRSGVPFPRQSDRVRTTTTANGSTASSSASAKAQSLFHSRRTSYAPDKLWGEFVVEVLLAERTARNEDELDYVKFVRNLYEI